MKELILIYNTNCSACLPYKEVLEELTHSNGCSITSYDLHDHPVETIGIILSLYERGFEISQLPFVYNGISIYEGISYDEVTLMKIINEIPKPSFL